MGRDSSTEDRGVPWSCVEDGRAASPVLSGPEAAGSRGCLLGELPWLASLIYCLFKQWA